MAAEPQVASSENVENILSRRIARLRPLSAGSNGVLVAATPPSVRAAPASLDLVPSTPPRRSKRARSSSLTPSISPSKKPRRLLAKTSLKCRECGASKGLATTLKLDELSLVALGKKRLGSSRRMPTKEELRGTSLVEVLVPQVPHQPLMAHGRPKRNRIQPLQAWRGERQVFFRKRSELAASLTGVVRNIAPPLQFHNPVGPLKVEGLSGVEVKETGSSSRTLRLHPGSELSEERVAPSLLMMLKGKLIVCVTGPDKATIEMKQGDAVLLKAGSNFTLSVGGWEPAEFFQVFCPGPGAAARAPLAS